jgi:hypothetical protein
MTITTHTAPAVHHLRNLVLSTTEVDLTEAVRAARARTAIDTAGDLREFTNLAAGVIGGSAALDALLIAEKGARGLEAAERHDARRILAQLRAAQGLADTPGINPKTVAVGTGTTGIGTGMPLIRNYALDRDFLAGGDAPITPGVIAGDTTGDVDPSTPYVGGTAFTIANVGSAQANHMAYGYANFARQVRDWTDPAALAMLDQIILDVADRAAEIYIGAALVTGAGGTRVAGADLTTLGTALDAAEAAAGTAINSAIETAGTAPGLLIVNPANWPKVRRAIGTSWPVGAPHPEVAVSIGAPTGTAIIVGPSAIHLFRDQFLHAARTAPAAMGYENTAARPFYLSIRAAAGIQTITSIPA